MMGKNLVTLAVLMSLTVAVTASKATVLDLQDGDQVNVVLVQPLVDPRVGGITLTLNGETYGGRGTTHFIGDNGVWAGNYLIDVNDLSNNPIADNYKSFCLNMMVDPTMGNAAIHNVLDNVSSDLEWMWGTYYNDIGSDAIKAAAFQLAVWEVMHEDGNNSHNLRTGDFFLSALNVNDVDNHGATLDGLINQANAYLNSNNWTARTDLMSLNRSGYQPFLIAVPEPATLVLLGLGLIAALIRRRH
jgi:hypothetical protein